MSQKFYKKAALFVLRAIAKHSPELALIVVHNDGLQTIIRCLEDFDPGVKEAAAWALGYIARHNKNLAQAAVDASKIILINISAIKKKGYLLIKYFAIQSYPYQARYLFLYCVCKNPNYILNKLVRRLLAT